MEPINALDNSHVITRLLSIGVCFLLFRYQSVEEIISLVFEEFNFYKEPGLLQFWKCIRSLDSEDIGCNLLLLDEPFRLADQNHEEVLMYRRKSHDNVIRFVGTQNKVIGNWFAGRAAQTGIADHRTKDLVRSHHYQQYAEAAGMGQCVLPVFYDVGDRKELAGIIELVTSVPKESYVEDFNQLVHLLQRRGLKSSFMGKTIKVQYDHMIKFNLPFSAKFTDLLTEVTKRFHELKNKRVCIKYKDTKSNQLISSDADLQKCMKESSSNGEAFIRMFVEHVDGTCDCT
uniref:uncharacterized protein LOC122582198 n=1 Tax=Erigeron canadensis TaxID=72917 RepID=UPI001CB8EE8A|nr:uncharacterized protein LOC122582198 [Erigeron canadensis]